MNNTEQTWHQELWRGFKEIPIEDNPSTLAVAARIFSQLKNLLNSPTPSQVPPREMRLIAGELLSLLTWSLPHSSEIAIQRLRSLLAS